MISRQITRVVKPLTKRNQFAAALPIRNVNRPFFSATATDTQQQQSPDQNTTDKQQSENSTDQNEKSEEDSNQTGGGATSYSSEKQVGNPISWANPTGGPTMDSTASNKWR